MSSANPANETRERELLSVQIAHQQLQNQLLELQIAGLTQTKPWHAVAIEVTPLVTTLLAVMGAISSLFYGIHQYQYEQKKNRDQHEQEFMKPWLETQREVYTQALSAAAAAVNSDDPEKQKEAVTEFWRLYHGKMILVETTEVSGAMKQMGAGLSGLASMDGKDLKT